MQYAVTVIIEAENLKAAIVKVPDDLGEVAAAVPRPTQPTAKTFTSSTVVPTPNVGG